MIVVRVELHSAITGKVTEIARMGIANVGGTVTHGDYSASTYRGRSRDALNAKQVQRHGRVDRYPRQVIHVWHLVARALVAMGYAPTGEIKQEADLFDAK